MWRHDRLRLGRFRVTARRRGSSASASTSRLQHRLRGRPTIRTSTAADADLNDLNKETRAGRARLRLSHGGCENRFLDAGANFGPSRHRTPRLASASVSRSETNAAVQREIRPPARRSRSDYFRRDYKKPGCRQPRIDPSDYTPVRLSADRRDLTSQSEPEQGERTELLERIPRPTTGSTPASTSTSQPHEGTDAVRRHQPGLRRDTCQSRIPPAGFCDQAPLGIPYYNRSRSPAVTRCRGPAGQRHFQSYPGTRVTAPSTERRAGEQRHILAEIRRATVGAWMDIFKTAHRPDTDASSVNVPLNGPAPGSQTARTARRTADAQLQVRGSTSGPGRRLQRLEQRGRAYGGADVRCRARSSGSILQGRLFRFGMQRSLGAAATRSENRLYCVSDFTWYGRWVQQARWPHLVQKA